MSLFVQPAPQLPRIRCAVCNRAVESVESWYSEAECGWTIVARCHGAQDAMKLGKFDAEHVRDLHEQIMGQEGVAFARKQIAA